MQQCMVTYFLHLCSIASVHPIINIGLTENHSKMLLLQLAGYSLRGNHQCVRFL